MFGPKVKVFANKEGGNDAIMFEEGPYQGVTFSYGKIEFPNDGEPDGDGQVHMKFEYEILSDISEEYDIKEFEGYIGDYLLDLIAEQISKNEVVYSGGVDED